MSNEVGPVPEGYVLWDGKEGDIIPEGAKLWARNRWVRSGDIGKPCQSDCAGRYAVPDPDIMASSVVEEAAAVASDYCGHSAVDHREALARVVRVVTGAEPDPKVLDHLMAKGARCYWVEVKR